MKRLLLIMALALMLVACDNTPTENQSRKVDDNTEQKTEEKRTEEAKTETLEDIKIEVPRLDESNENAQDETQEQGTERVDYRIDPTGLETYNNMELELVDSEYMKFHAPANYQILKDGVSIYFYDEVSEDNYVGIAISPLYYDDLKSFEELAGHQKREIDEAYDDATYNTIEMAGYQIALSNYTDTDEYGDYNVWEYMVYLGDKSTENVNGLMIGVLGGDYHRDGYKYYTVEEILKDIVIK